MSIPIYNANSYILTDLDYALLMTFYTMHLILSSISIQSNPKDIYSIHIEKIYIHSLIMKYLSEYHYVSSFSKLA
jgi:hypothetical protein